ncbi:hypothetical protein Aca07nite_48260 [Actinoplanes capillaceus]|uniref:DNA-binding beta-propeller fold protein YncE n=2 Tax=Actinoplanes campanulatus TaxID=113559 RepID=A0ABQ3WMR2_9ACTN|nr:hypothetical protein Aca07nite_48260 [Actinoplanes capillaceus]
MRMSRAALAAAVLIGSSTLAVSAFAAPALATPYAPLALTSFGDIVVDGVHQRIFITDPSAQKVVVTDYSGAVIDELEGYGFVDDLALSADSSRLYFGASHAIVEVDTGTLAEAKRYPLGDTVYPGDVVPAGGKLWFGYGRDDRGSFGSVDPADSTVWLDPPSAEDGFSDSRPYVYGSPAAPGTIVVSGDQFAREGSITVYDVSSGSAVERVRGSAEGTAAKETAFTADGTGLVRVADLFGEQIRVSDLSTVVTYPALARANGVDVATDGRIAVSVANQTTGDDIYVFEGAGTTATQTIRLPEAGGEAEPGSGELARDGVQDRGIAWQPGGPRLFAVAKYDRAFRLWVLNAPADPIVKQTPALALNGNGGIFGYGSTVNFTARLGATHTNRVVEIWADPYGPEAKRLLKRGTVNSSGYLTASLKVTRNTTLTATFAGDERYDARTVTSTVQTRAAVATAVSKHYKTAKKGSVSYFYFHKKATPKFTTTMTAYPGRRQQVIVEYWSGGKWRAWSKRFVAVKADGKSVAAFTGTHRVGVKFRVRAAYLKGTSGDSANYTTYGAWKYFTFTK